ncbi:hypothetical protein ACIFOT_27115 [Neobacillus sp. NRS-1170]|uniref:magnesium chelatase subunit ChlI family protein n=1 Tax=Neobacillus sp. NRS-1170 TaxID=3233898 RepID=UPI003D2B5AF3
MGARDERWSKSGYTKELSFNNGFSNRTQIKIIRLARTISDLHGNSRITDLSIWEGVKLNGGA